MINQSLMAKAFNNAASSYEQHAVLQLEVGQRLLERLDYIKLQPKHIIDIGAGTGRCSAELVKRYKSAQIYALDIAPAMLQQAKQNQGWWRKFHCICGDAGKLPIADASMDMIISNLTLQWCMDLSETFAEWRRVLKPGGLLMFTTLGPDTLKELRQSWTSIDDYQHVNQFIDMHYVGDALLQAGFAEPVMDMEYLTLTYQEMKQLMRDLKGIGAHYVGQQRHMGLMGKQRFAQLQQAYEQYRQDGLLPATYELVYGHAWLADLQPESISVLFKK